MSDMLVKLYELPDLKPMIDEQKKMGREIRKPIGPEKHTVLNWVATKFGQSSVSQIDLAMTNTPRTCFIAQRDKTLIGFACYDVAALGIFGPIALDEPARGKGTGKALLLACLHDMKAKGYGYAVIGGVGPGPTEFYQKSVKAEIIPDSSPGIYKNQL